MNRELIKSTCLAFVILYQTWQLTMQYEVRGWLVFQNCYCQGCHYKRALPGISKTTGGVSITACMYMMRVPLYSEVVIYITGILVSQKWQNLMQYFLPRIRCRSRRSKYGSLRGGNQKCYCVATKMVAIAN